MQTYLDCFPCLLRQAIEATRMAGATESQEREVLMKTLKILQHIPEGATPPEMGMQVHQAVRQITGKDDPYLKVKHEATHTALAMLPELHLLLDRAENRLETALRLSIAGNIMDFGPNPDFNLRDVIERILHQDFAIDDTEQLYQKLVKAESILFLGDNAGETVFDRLLIETIETPVTYVVRGGPVLNDATIEDAVMAGIDQVAEVIDNGARVPGTILSLCNQEFLQRFQKADLILAKGMGNYETLSEVKAPLFFLFQVKCPIIGLDVGVPTGSIVISETRGTTSF